MPRSTPGGVIYHVLNRANAGLVMFRSKAEYATFLEALAEAHARVPVRLLGFCLMSDHWHLVVWPRKEGELSEFMRWLTVTHTRRWHARRHVAGSGHLYQGRYRSFPVEPGKPLLTVLRYVEGNARRSKEVRKAEDWEWSSLAIRAGKKAEPVDEMGAVEHLLDPGPTALPANWTAMVNAPLEAEDLVALRNSVQRGTPLGAEPWQGRMVKKLNLAHTLRPRGRPRKHPLLPDAEPPVESGKKKPQKPGLKMVRKAASPVPKKGTPVRFTGRPVR